MAAPSVRARSRRWPWPPPVFVPGVGDGHGGPPVFVLRVGDGHGRPQCSCPEKVMAVAAPQCSCPEKPTKRGAWRATVRRGREHRTGLGKNATETKRLSVVFFASDSRGSWASWDCSNTNIFQPLFLQVFSCLLFPFLGLQINEYFPQVTGALWIFSSRLFSLRVSFCTDLLIYLKVHYYFYFAVSNVLLISSKKHTKYCIILLQKLHLVLFYSWIHYCHGFHYIFKQIHNSCFKVLYWFSIFYWPLAIVNFTFLNARFSFSF